MAVGMVNSMNNLRDASPTVIRAGERIATTAEALKDKNAKRYFHMIPGAKFMMPDGLEIQFLGGQFVTADPAIIAELNKIANKPTSLVFTQQEAVGAATALQKQAAADAADTAGTIKQ